MWTINLDDAMHTSEWWNRLTATCTRSSQSAIKAPSMGLSGRLIFALFELNSCKVNRCWLSYRVQTPARSARWLGNPELHNRGFAIEVCLYELESGLISAENE